jgi:hypothetical protein
MQIGERRNAYKLLIQKTEGRNFGAWIHLAHNRD